MKTAVNGGTQRLDDALVDPHLYAEEHDLHALYAMLRRDDPVRFVSPKNMRPFWAITRHADILEVERQNALFVNSKRTYLATTQAEAWVHSVTGDTHLFRTLVDLDEPLHMKLRALTQPYFMPASLKKLEARIAGIAKTHVDRMAALGGACDFVQEVALWYPLRVIMEILGVPEFDEAFMLKMTQEIFGPQDPDVVASTDRQHQDENVSSVDLMATAQELFAYFGALTQDRRAHPKDDLATIIANGQIDGAPIGHLEAMSYYIIVATAGHDTTSSTAAGGLLQLIQNPDQMAKLKADMSLLPGAVEEMIRWVTPVKHFMRTATEDAMVGGQRISKDDGLCLFYWSGNRDESVFEDPFAFKVDRSPNKQIAFGYGAHLCLGMHLARMEIRALFEELLPRLHEVELAGTPRNTRANFVSGLKTLPLRYKMS
jgi:cytochrome P450